MFILDPNAYARDAGGVAGKVQRLVEGAGGSLLASRLWNEQKLAYPINGRHKGAYWLTYFRMSAAKLTEFSRACRLSDIVMRHLVLKVDPRLVDTLVAAAKGEITVTSRAATMESASPGSPEGDDGRGRRRGGRRRDTADDTEGAAEGEVAAV
jgi:small subunit ribosomal protein S6